MRWRHPYETHPPRCSPWPGRRPSAAAPIGPDYQRRTWRCPGSEAEGWRRAEPRDVFQRGAWWELYGDQTLNDLQMHLERSNQTLAQSVAQFRQAEALVRARAAFFPSITGNVGKTRSGQGGGDSTVLLPGRLDW